MTKNVERLSQILTRMRRLPVFEPRLASLQLNLTLPQLALLGWVVEHPGCHVQQVAEAFGLSAPTVSVGVRRLERADLLERRPDPQDRRAANLYASARAEEMHAEFVQHHHQGLAFFLSGLSPAEQSQLLTLLERAVARAEARPSDSESIQGANEA